MLSHFDGKVGRLVLGMIRYRRHIIGIAQERWKGWVSSNKRPTSPRKQRKERTSSAPTAFPTAHIPRPVNPTTNVVANINAFAPSNAPSILSPPPSPSSFEAVLDDKGMSDEPYNAFSSRALNNRLLIVSADSSAWTRVDSDPPPRCLMSSSEIGISADMLALE